MIFVFLVIYECYSTTGDLGTVYQADYLTNTYVPWDVTKYDHGRLVLRSKILSLRYVRIKLRGRLKFLIVNYLKPVSDVGFFIRASNVDI